MSAKSTCLRLLVGGALVGPVRAQVTHYVNAAAASPMTPFTNWATAATNILDAFAACAGGDTICVTDGVYRAGAVINLASDITLASVNGRSATTLAGDGSHGILHVTAAGAIVDGFTICGGQANHGGGAYLYGGGLIRNCAITGNVAVYDGGGVYLEYGGLLSNCLVAGNYAANHGGGLYTDYGGMADGCTISNNIAGNRGGGLYSEMYCGPVTACEIVHNQASNYGGGAYLYGHGMLLTNCRVARNQARTRAGGIYFYINGVAANCRIEQNEVTDSGGGGGGVYIEQNGTVNGGWIVGNLVTNTSGCGGGVYFNGGGLCRDAVISNNQSAVYGGGAYLYLGGRMGGCRIENNRASSGGGIMFSSAGGMVTNSRILANASAGDGGGVYFMFGGQMQHCLIARNSASNGMNGTGGGAYLYGGVLESSTVADNFAQSWGGGLVRSEGSVAINSIIYFNRSGGTSGSNYYDTGAVNYSNCCAAPLPAGPANTAADPLLADRAGGDYTPRTNSPCVNTGVNREWMADTTDLGTNPRIQNAVTDIGAFETPYWGMTADVDGDRFSDWIETGVLGTDPTNATSFLGINGLDLDAGPPAGYVIRWKSQSGRAYQVYRAFSLTNSSDYIRLFTNVPGQIAESAVTDRTATASAFYRIGVDY